MAGFDRENKYWMNYHQRIFRANGTEAKLAISDWASDPSTPRQAQGLERSRKASSPRRRSGQARQAKAGRPAGAGQELMFNFLEVQPYLDP